MALVISACVMIAGVLLLQSISVMRTGNTLQDLSKTSHESASKPTGPFSRTIHATIYLFPALGIIAILATALKRVGFAPIRAWLAQDGGMFFWVVIFLVVGASYLVQPARMLRWTISKRPELAEAKGAVRVARVIGLGLIVIAFFVLSRL